MHVRTICLACRKSEFCLETANCSGHRHFNAADAIYHMGDRQDGVWQVVRGYVALKQYSPSGDVAVLRVVKRGGMFGYRSFVSGEARGCSAVALTGVHLKHVPSSLLGRLVDREPAVQRALQVGIVQALRDTQERLACLANNSVRSRFIKLLQWLADAEGVAQPPSGFSLQLPFAYQEVAQIIAVSPETLSRATRRLQREGVVTVDGRVLAFTSKWACQNPDSSRSSASTMAK